MNYASPPCYGGGNHINGIINLTDKVLDIVPIMGLMGSMDGLTKKNQNHLVFNPGCVLCLFSNAE